jgi:hypothetical protein
MMNRTTCSNPEKQTVGILLLQQFYYVDNDGTAKPAAPEKSELLDSFISNTQPNWDNGMVQLNPRANKSELLGYFLLSTIQPT